MDNYRKLTDDEIIKALECCAIASTNEDCYGLNCPCFNKNIGMCMYIDEEDALQNKALQVIKHLKESNNNEKIINKIYHFLCNRSNWYKLQSQQLVNGECQWLKDILNKFIEEK